MQLNFLIIFIINCCVNGSWSQLSCMDENNSPVDWFIALKYHRSAEFVYLKPSVTDWKPSSKNLSSPENMIALTIGQSYNPKVFYAYYNNAPAEINSDNDWYYSAQGHLKGVINFDKSAGYWLIHSVPKFPKEGSYYYRKGAEKFGQSFICVTIGIDNLSSIVRQLMMMKSKVYSNNLPGDFSKDDALMGDLQRFVKNRGSSSQKSKTFRFKTLKDVSFVHFGKSDLFNDDLYAGLIAPTLQTSLYVETWIRRYRLKSSCNSKYKVYNVEYVKLVDSVFKETQDHSKWAVSTSQDQPYVCIGDINRMSSQFKRGGGSLCLSNLDIWKTFNKLVKQYEKCDYQWFFGNIL